MNPTEIEATITEIIRHGIEDGQQPRHIAADIMKVVSMDKADAVNEARVDAQIEMVKSAQASYFGNNFNTDADDEINETGNYFAMSDPDHDDR